MAKTNGKTTGKKATQTGSTKTTKTTTAKVVKTAKVQTGGNATNATNTANVANTGADGKPTRYYKLITIENGVAVCRGRYSGQKPRQAANKACTKLYREHPKDNFPAQIIFGMHECTRSAKKKKKFFYIGTRELLPKPEEVPIHQKDENGEYVLDASGNKVPKINAKTGQPLVIRYATNSDVKKLSNPDDFPEFNLLRDYDAVNADDDNEDEQEGGARTTKAKTPAKATKTAKAATTTKKATATKATKTTKAAPKARATAKPKTATKKAVAKPKAKAAAKPKAAAKGGKTPVVNKNAKNTTVKGKAAPKTATKKPAAKKTAKK